MSLNSDPNLSCHMQGESSGSCLQSTLERKRHNACICCLLFTSFQMLDVQQKMYEEKVSLKTSPISKYSWVVNWYVNHSVNQSMTTDFSMLSRIQKDLSEGIDTLWGKASKPDGAVIDILYTLLLFSLASWTSGMMASTAVVVFWLWGSFEDGKMWPKSWPGKEKQSRPMMTL